MDKFFVCLANSYKHGGRCIAGVEVEWKDRWRIVRNEAGLPKWIRPVSRSSSTGEIPNELASGITPLDVVLLNKVVPCGEGAQSENVYFDSMAPIGKRYKSTSVLLERFSDESHKHLFYNYGKTVTPDIFLREGTHSILLIHATLSEVYADTSFADAPRYRVRFVYRNHSYALPITDPVYLREISHGRKSLGAKGELFLTCSLGLLHEGFHYKLAACIFETERSKVDAADVGWFEKYDQELKSLLEQKEEIESRIKAIRMEIMQKMSHDHIRVLEADNFIVSLSPARSYMSFDSQSFKLENEELYTRYCKEKQREATLVIKRRDTGKKDN